MGNGYTTLHSYTRDNLSRGLPNRRSRTSDCTAGGLRCICTNFARGAEMSGKQMAAQYPSTTLIQAADAALLTPQQLSEKLNVPASWVREKTRQRARVRDNDPLPCIRLGKYTRFRWSEIEAWLARQIT
jgi:hypothetical protein